MNGIHQNGKATFTAGAAIARGEFVKFSTGKVVKAAAATDVCIGVALDSAAASGDLIPVQLLTSGDTVIVKAGGAVAQGGSVSCLGTTVSTAGTLQYGYALEAATSSGDLIECMVGLPAVTKIS
ncbi:MAG: DUF2190 family protein [Kiritimatiellae bacterium]|nr:DUF2190 family protein [Kiritimatiellia bacterium]